MLSALSLWAHHRAQVLNQVVAAHASGPLRSPITTHVLDASLGVPARGLPIQLLKQDAVSKTWETVSGGLTNEDGRIGNLLPPGNYVTPGRCALTPSLCVASPRPAVPALGLTCVLRALHTQVPHAL